MKIIHLEEFSSGVCGVHNVTWNIARVQVKRGHEVYILSSDRVKGGGVAPANEEIDGIKVFRFPVSFTFGENTAWWSFKEKFMEIKPDIVFCHCMRHPHCSKGLKYGRQINAKTFLITHAPFLDRKLRGWKLHLATKAFDTMYKSELLKYDKVIATTKWELPELRKLGCPDNKVVHVPNGFPQEFIEAKMEWGGAKPLFFGRNHPIKGIETLEKACAVLGQEFDLVDNIPMNDLDSKIRVLNEHAIFVLPSLREAFPGALVEALALGRVCIASRTQGAKALIEHGKNGFLFNIGDFKELARLIDYCQRNMDSDEIVNMRKAARVSVKDMTWPKIVDKLEELYRKQSLEESK